MEKALAIDIGGTKIYNAIIDKNGNIISEIEKAHTPKTFVEIKETLANIVKRHENEVDLVAFCTCGAVNNENTGIVGSTGNIAKEYPTMKFQELSTRGFLCSHSVRSLPDASSRQEANAPAGCCYRGGLPPSRLRHRILLEKARILQ